MTDRSANCRTVLFQAVPNFCFFARRWPSREWSGHKLGLEEGLPSGGRLPVPDMEITDELAACGKSVGCARLVDTFPSEGWHISASPLKIADIVSKSDPKTCLRTCASSLIAATASRPILCLLFQTLIGSTTLASLYLTYKITAG